MEGKPIRKCVYEAISWFKFFIKKGKRRNKFAMLVIHINESGFQMKSLLGCKVVD